MYLQYCENDLKPKIRKDYRWAKNAQQVSLS